MLGQVLGEVGEKGLLVQNKETGFHISPFQSGRLLTGVFRGNTSGPSYSLEDIPDSQN